MSQPRTRVQRYRLTWEFTLRDRGDYEFARALIKKALYSVTGRMVGITGDYLAVEKIEEPK